MYIHHHNVFKRDPSIDTQQTPLLLFNIFSCLFTFSKKSIISFWTIWVLKFLYLSLSIWWVHFIKPLINIGNNNSVLGFFMLIWSRIISREVVSPNSMMSILNVLCQYYIICNFKWGMNILVNIISEKSSNVNPSPLWDNFPNFFPNLY